MALSQRARLTAAACGILAGALCLTWLASPPSPNARAITANAGPFQRYNLGLPGDAPTDGSTTSSEGPAGDERPILRLGLGGGALFRLPDPAIGIPGRPSTNQTPSTQTADGPAAGTNAGAGGSPPPPATDASDDPPAPTMTVLAHTQHSDGKRVALTFDDGPSPVFTQQFLAVLRHYRIKATFCLIGSQVRAYPQLVREIAADGHRLCDHTMTHDERLPRRSTSRIRHEILDDRDLIAEAGDQRLWYYRAPGGAFSSRVDAVAVGGGMQPLGWSVDTEDWKRPGVSAIVAAVHRELRPGGVILMHDAGGPRQESLAALRILIPWLIDQGYQFDFPA